MSEQTVSHATLLVGLREATGAEASANADRLLAGDHTYLRVVADEKGVITIEQIRELISFFRLKVPGRATIRRVAIIQSADQMGREAQNALLKLLEEPPLDSVLILTSEQPRLLLPTILSRVQIQQIHTDAVRPDSQAVQLVKEALGGTSYDRMLLVDGLVKQKGAASEFADTLATVAMASLQAAASKGSGTIERWKKVLQAAHEAQESLDRNGNVKLVLTELMLAL